MLKIQSDRVIIDGHEPTKEQCETMTLLANALAKSESFKTVKYESGYAEFEKIGKADELKFVGEIGFSNHIAIYFDSHITKVTEGNSAEEWTTSGELFILYDSSINQYVFTVTLENGYILDTVTLSVNGEASTILTDNTGTTFTIPAGANGTGFDITLTSKQATPKVSVDLTTLPGWSSLSSGSHSITIVAKAENYRDSEPSAAVSVTNGAALISFTIDGTSYQAEEGMTWAEWVNSSYNTDGFYVHNNRISTTGTNFISTKNIQSTEYAEYSTNVIAKETVYYLLSLNTTPPSGGGGGVGN